MPIVKCTCFHPAPLMLLVFEAHQRLSGCIKAAPCCTVSLPGCGSSPDAEDSGVEADGRQLDEREHAAQGAAGRVEAEARLLSSVQVQAQIALYLLAQPLQQALLNPGQQLVVIGLHSTSCFLGIRAMQQLTGDALLASVAAAHGVLG